MLMFIQTNIRAQVLEKVQNAFSVYQQHVFKEKIYVHTDKEKYLAGETIWLKVYTIDASKHQPTDLSKVAYVELLDDQNQPAAQLKIMLKVGSGNGSVEIPKSLKTGIYKLRSYTNWMKNFEVELFFKKKITILNPQVFANSADLAQQNFDIQFFAEGGDLIEGLKSNIGFKAVGENGLGLNLSGAVIDQKNDTVARFKTSRFGIGKFQFIAQPNTTYKAVITSFGKEKLIKNFLIAKKQGYAMVLSNQQNGKLTIDLSSNLNNEKVYLITHRNKNISNVINTSLIGGKASFTIDEEKLDEGISHFTIFNETGNAVSERLFFKRPTKKLDIKLTSDKTEYAQRSKVDVGVNVKDPLSASVPTDLSISVRKIDAIQGLDDSDIVSYFWLVSELKGNVESPSYYLNNINKDVDSDLNNLLITQGWRKFNWDEILQAKVPAFKFLPEYNGHLIKGSIKDKNGSPLYSTKLYLGSAGKIGQFYETMSDADGNFNFNTKDFYGLNEIVVQTDLKDTTAVIAIQSPFFEKFSENKPNVFKFNTTLANQLENYNVSSQVQNAFYVSKINYIPQLKTDSSKFYVKAFKTYKFNDYDRFKTMEESLREVVKETFISKSNDSYRVKLLAKDVPMSGDPLVLLDGLPYFNMDKVMSIDPNKIERLEIVPESYNYGSSKFDGILSFHSFKSNLANIEINPNAVVLDYEGLQLQREFYSPTYDLETNINNRLPDFRNVLYWSPALSINETGEGKVTFFTSDVAGTYIGTVNGLNKNGTFGNATFTFKVNEKSN